ncbi:MAG TPA: YdeI/OmpD-associated family protein [Anaerolineae bacterium]|nr:YdeI/OmpD-associated family protein [Anaerolineae bacterium]
MYKKGAHPASLSFEEAQAEALCFGWTDVKSKNIDPARYALRFTPRRANSVWSMTNIRRVETLIAAGRMTDAGLARITEAQHNGQWEAGIKSEQTDQIPADLEKALRRSRGALDRYKSLPHSHKKQLLRGLFTAKSPATRQRRIEAIVQKVAE